VTAASTTANIVVQGSGGYQVSTTIGVDNIPHVAVGQSASVVPDGAHKTLSGKVASISIAPNSTSALSTTYLVVIALKHPNLKLGNGSTGVVTITTQHAKSTLAVPTSAVTTSGTSHTVEVLDGNTPRRTTVRVGVVGYTWTQITSGLKLGQQVVLAQLSQALPGSATSSSSTSNSSSNARTAVNGGGTSLFGGRGGGAGLRGG
jgi:trimeric autotransporter adhesin